MCDAHIDSSFTVPVDRLHSCAATGILSLHDSPLKRRPTVSTPAPAALAPTARRLTEAAALACRPWIGRGNKDAADAAAVDALYSAFADAPFRGQVIIGEGEKDNAPYLAPGERVGPGGPPSVDIAVDPLEGTRLVADNAPGALSVLALVPAGCMLPLGRAFYMQKLIGPPAAAEVLDLDAPPRAVVHEVADALAVAPSDLRVAVQERPRHEALVRTIQKTGACVRLFADGDLSFALLALHDRTATSNRGPIDLLWGVGGAPEGMLAAAAQRVLGGAMRMRLAPRSKAERRRLARDPAPDGALTRTFTAADLIRTNAVAMTLTGVTDGPLLHGIRSDGSPDARVTETLVLRTGARPRRVTTRHDAAK